MLLRALAVVAGTFTAVFPERVVESARDAALGACYENPGDLQPKEWYVDATRLQGAILAAAGVLAVAFDALVEDRNAADVSED
jgi:hypothetical protein